MTERDIFFDVAFDGLKDFVKSLDPTGNYTECAKEYLEDLGVSCCQADSVIDQSDMLQEKLEHIKKELASGKLSKKEEVLQRNIYKEYHDIYRGLIVIAYKILENDDD